MRSPLNKLLFVSIAIMALSAAANNHALAEDYFVNNEIGDDLNNGLARPPMATNIGRYGPFKSIGRALEIARLGDRIFVEKTDKPYRESITVQGGAHNGTPMMKFQILSNGAILDGTRPVNDKWEHVQKNLYRFKPEYKSYQQLYQDGRPLPQTKLGQQGQPEDLEPNQWTLHKGWIYFHTDGSNPIRYDLSYCYHPVGITLYQVHDVVIEGFIVQGFQLDGVNAHDLVKDTALVSNVFRGNGRSGVSVGGASRVSLVANLIGDNGEAQLRTEGYSKTWLENCDIVDSGEFGQRIDQIGGQVILVDEDNE